MSPQSEPPTPPPAERKQDRSWLATYLLMMLRSWNAYGYELVRQLALFGFGAIDPANVYRALRELERDGYVTSAWDTSVTSGPARRVYTITDAGLATLQLWSGALDNYRQSLDRLFQLYQGGGAEAQRRTGAEANDGDRTGEGANRRTGEEDDGTSARTH